MCVPAMEPNELVSSVKDDCHDRLIHAIADGRQRPNNH
uniref:ABC transporter B family member 9-like n=1 Tax=Rhizophora mucronata TaxID=61149 RepID=A0A2P2MIE2_RHIMU